MIKTIDQLSIDVVYCFRYELLAEWRTSPADAGYIIDLDGDSESMRSTFDHYVNRKWLDERTHALILEMSIFEPSSRLFSVILIAFESLPTGEFVPWYSISSSPLYLYDWDNLKISDLGFEIFFVVSLVFVSCRELRIMIATNFIDYFTNLWVYLDILVVISSWTIFGFFIKRILIIHSTMRRYKSSQEFVSFYPALLWDYYVTYMYAVLVTLLTIKLLLLLGFNRRILILQTTIRRALKTLVSFFVFFLIAMVMYTAFGMTLLQPYCAGLRSFPASFMTLLNFCLQVSLNEFSKFKSGDTV